MLTAKKKKLLREFKREFPSDETCEDVVLDFLREEELLHCHHCGSMQVEKHKRRRVRCVECRGISWFTAGTPFDHSKKLRAFFGLLYFDNHGQPLNSSEAHDHLDVAQASAWKMIKKIELVHEAGQSVDEESHVMLSCEAFISTIKKRSRETPANQPPSAEIQPVEQSKTSTDASPNSEAEKILSALTSTKSPANVETLSELTQIAPHELWLQLTYLELDNRIKSAGGRYTLNRTHPAASLPVSNSVPIEVITKRVSGFVEFLQRNFHGTSRKYLQLYLFQFARVSSEVRMNWDSLMRKMIRHGPVPDGEIRRYSSPQAVCLLL